MQARSDHSRFREQRRSALLRSAEVSGIDFVEVTRDAASPDRFRLRLHFLGMAPAELTASNVAVRSPQGVLDSGLGVESVRRLEDSPGCDEVTVRIHDPARAERLARDPSDYRLELVGLKVDPFFSAASFRFDGEPGGAAALGHAVAAESPYQEIDYLAKDFQSFRRLMLEQLSVRVPEWTERNPADLGVAVVEVLAYVADYLSYYQDAVATEAYLDTARKRSSVRRHLRLLGHTLHQGCNARAWTQIQVDRTKDGKPIEMPEGTRLLTRVGGLPATIPFPSRHYDTALARGSLVFETLHPVRLRQEHNRMGLYAWSTDVYSLPAGATSAALEGHFPELREGDVLVLEAARAQPLAEGEANDALRCHPVRLSAPPRLGTDPLNGARITEIDFFEEDALPSTLVVAASTARQPVRVPIHARKEGDTLPQGSISATLEGHCHWLQAGDLVVFERSEGAGAEAAPARRHEVSLSGPCRLVRDSRSGKRVTEIDFEDDPLPFTLMAAATTAVGPADGSAVARGNIVLADHGQTVREPLPEVHSRDRYEPPLSRPELTWRVPFEGDRARRRSAESALRQAPELALPALLLEEHRGAPGSPPRAGDRWRPRTDLLDSHAFGRHLVVETESDGGSRLRFGDGVLGRRPSAGTRLEAVYRVGNGPAGNVGPGSLAHVVAQGSLPVLKVRNPSASRGGELPEPLERARLVAPRAFRERKVSVTADDCAALAGRHPEVLSAAGRVMWTGSWPTFFVHVQRRNARELDPAFEARLRRYLEGSLLADRDLEIQPPRPLALEVSLRGRLAEGFLRESVQRKLLEALSDRRLPDGRLGFFHPDRFTLGRTLYLGQLLDTAMKVAGVALVEAEVFRPYGAASADPAVRDRVEPGPFEMVSLRNVAASPELGSLEITLEGGS
ncbi:MAG: hypothetical protein GY719_14330 [bacterium]|nr:hypothetical protein [bacterium]